MSKDYSIDDLENLVIPFGHRKTGICIINEYSLDSLTEMKNINCSEVMSLIEKVNDISQNIYDEKTKTRILNWKKTLEKTLNSNQEFNPGEYYENKTPCNFARDCINICNFKGIISFLDNVFKNAKIWDKKGNSDTNTLYKIVNEVQNTCKNLGIRSLSADNLYDRYMDPESDATYNVGIRPEIDYDNSLEDDITIWSIPYIIKVPEFNINGEIINYLNMPINEAICYYNVQKYDELVKNAEKER